jgi:hypothetical protein
MTEEQINAVKWLNANYGDKVKVSANSSLSDIEFMGEILANYKASDGDLADVSKCTYCGSENVTVESDGVWCSDCTEWESKKYDC